MAKATLAATALAATSNILAQLLEAHNATTLTSPAFSLDILQIVRFAFVIALTTPPNYLWQTLLERTFPAYGPCPEDTDDTGDTSSSGSGKRGDEHKHGKKKKRTSSNADIDIEKQIPLSFQAPSSPPSPTTSARRSSIFFSTASPTRRLNWRNTMTKWFVDCITLGALFNTLAFFVLMGLLKNQPLSQIAATVHEQTMPLILAGYRIWPLASIVSFTVVPVEKRVVFMNFVGLLWGVYMSIVAARV